MKPIEQILKEAILCSGRPFAQIAKEAGVPQPCLHHFMHGNNGLQLRSLEKLLPVLGLVVVRKEDVILSSK